MGEWECEGEWGSVREWGSGGEWECKGEWGNQGEWEMRSGSVRMIGVCGRAEYIFSH